MTVEGAATLTDEQRANLAAVADRLIPAAHGMPSAGAVVNEERLRFVVTARPDLAEPLRAALGAGPADADARLDMLARDNPQALGALQLVIVAGYYTDKTVRELIGYPGQMAVSLRSWELPEYLDEGLIDAVLARGPIWRDPATGQRASGTGTPRTYAERFSAEAAPPAAAPSEGGSDGHDRA